MHKNINNSELVLIIIVFLVIAFLLCLKQYRSKSIINNAEYTIGTITKYNERQKKHGLSGGALVQKTKPAYIEFYFTCEDTLLFSYYSENSFDIPASSIKVGEKFLVAYNKDNPQKSMVIFEKPIYDSSDFRRYLNELTLNLKTIKTIPELNPKPLTLNPHYLLL